MRKHRHKYHLAVPIFANFVTMLVIALVATSARKALLIASPEGSTAALKVRRPEDSVETDFESLMLLADTWPAAFCDIMLLLNENILSHFTLA